MRVSEGWKTSAAMRTRNVNVSSVKFSVRREFYGIAVVPMAMNRAETRGIRKEETQT